MHIQGDATQRGARSGCVRGRCSARLLDKSRSNVGDICVPFTSRVSLLRNRWRERSAISVDGLRNKGVNDEPKSGVARRPLLRGVTIPRMYVPRDYRDNKSGTYLLLFASRLRRSHFFSNTYLRENAIFMCNNEQVLGSKRVPCV